MALRLCCLGHSHLRNRAKNLQRTDHPMPPIRNLGSLAPLNETIRVNGQKCPSLWQLFLRWLGIVLMLQKKKKKLTQCQSHKHPPLPGSLGHWGNLPSVSSLTCELHMGRNPGPRQGESWRLTSELNAPCQCTACKTTPLRCVPRSCKYSFGWRGGSGDTETGSHPQARE